MRNHTPRAVTSSAEEDSLEDSVTVLTKDDVERVEEILWGAGPGDGCCLRRRKGKGVSEKKEDEEEEEESEKRGGERYGLGEGERIERTRKPVTA